MKENQTTKPLANRLNQYRILWLFIAFDLPTETNKDIRNYTRFRKGLIQDGFAMLQYSIYVRHCASRENAAVHEKRVKKMLPPKGEIMMFMLTDRQYGMMEFFRGPKEADKPEAPQQLELF